MARLIKVNCGCGGHSHCPKCSGRGYSDSHRVEHPHCHKAGCRGVMFPVGPSRIGPPNSSLKCDVCGATGTQSP